MKRLILIIGSMILGIYLVPHITIDPWKILSLKKILTLVTAITFMQLLSLELVKILGPKRGAVMTGFLSGLISSTATVATTAKLSKISPAAVSSQILIYISSTVAMQLIALSIVLLGTKGVHYNLLIIILFPVIGAVGMIFYESRVVTKGLTVWQDSTFELSHIFKLTFLIVFTLYASKISELYFEGGNQKLLTFLVSLFEMHGSIIVNLQLHDAGTLSVDQLGTLLTVSILSSYTSKFFFVLFLGSRELKIEVAKYSALSLLMIGLGWTLFHFLQMKM